MVAALSAWPRKKVKTERQKGALKKV
jgi:hypothetical protein